MAHIYMYVLPWPLSQSNPWNCIIQYNDPLFNNNDYYLAQLENCMIITKIFIIVHVHVHVVKSFTLFYFLIKQLLTLERERIQKWVKMTKNWDKYIRGEKVI